MAEFFFVDTTPFQDMYFTTPKDHTYDWRNVMPRKDYLSQVLKVNLFFEMILRMIIEILFYYIGSYQTIFYHKIIELYLNIIGSHEIIFYINKITLTLSKFHRK